MAHLSGPDAGRLGGGGDRGQLLLVAVLVLAASFVVLALVVNSAIFAENLATREDVAGSEKALEYRAEVIDSVGQMVVVANGDSSLSTQSELESHTQSEIAILSARGGFSQAVRGGVVDLSYQDATMGQRIAQDNPSRNLTGRNETADWTLAEDVDNLRNVRFTFPGPDSPGGPFFPSESDAFSLVLEDNGASTWTVSFYGDVTVSVQRPDGTEAECTRSEPGTDEELTVDVTGGTVDGEPCHALDRLSGGTEMWLGTGLSDPYDIEFENGDNVNGSYSMVIDNGNPDLSRLHSGHNPDEPYLMDALYEVVLSYAYQNSAVAYEDTLRVAPGETPSPLSPGALYSEPDQITDNTGVGGSVTGNEQIEIKGESVVKGDIESGSKEVKILDQSTVEGSVTANDFVKVEDVTVEGDVYIDESDFDCTNSVINGQDCSSYTPEDPGDWPP